MMRDFVLTALEKYRYREFPFADINGAYLIPGPCGMTLKIIASDGTFGEGAEKGWEHVSVSVKNRTPNWQEMCFVKNLFWADDEIVFQLHPAKNEWISNHPYVLHMWRHRDKPVPLPPSHLVGVKEAGELKNKQEAIAARQKYFPDTLK